MGESGVKDFTKDCIRYFIIYTVLFIGMVMIVFYPQIAGGKTLVWGLDGVPQYYNVLLYQGNMIREHGLFSPMWDLSVGLGQDVWTTFSYYGIYDPLNWTAALVKPEHMDVLYSVLICVRLYLAGLSFSCFELYSEKKAGRKLAVLTGAFVYCFCVHAIYLCVCFPNFIAPMIFFPILLLGMKKIYKGEKPYLFIIFIALAAINNFYYFYMLCIFMFIFGILQYAEYVHIWNLRNIGYWMGKFVGFFLMGIALAGVALVPIVLNMLKMDRLTIDAYLPLFYDRVYYSSILTGLMTGQGAETLDDLSVWPQIGLSAVAIFLILYLLAGKKGWEKKAALITVTLFLCIPFIGYALNGFGYLANRWVWAYCFVAADIVVYVLGEWISPDRHRMIVMVGLVVGFVALCLLNPDNGLRQQKCTWIQAGILFLLLILLGIVYFKNEQIRKMNTVRGCIIFGICIISILCNVAGIQKYISERSWDWFVPKGEAYRKMMDVPSAAVKQIQGTKIGRYDSYGTLETYNTAMAQGLYGTSYYFSMTNPYVVKFMKENYVNHPVDFQYSNLDSRGLLDAIAGVEYFLVNAEDKAYVPCGYREREPFAVSDNLVYSGGLPIAFVYDSFIPKEKWEALPVEEKQQALVQGAIVDSSTLPETEIWSEAETLSYRAVCDDQEIEFSGEFCPSEYDRSIDLLVKDVKEGELFIIFDNIRYIPDENTDIRVETDEVQKRVNIYGKKESTYCGNHNFLCNLGYTQAADEKRITLKFRDEEKYLFDDIRVVVQPYDRIMGEVEKLRKNGYDHLVLDKNKICVDLTLQRQGMLYFAIPFDQGFSVFVDGIKQPLKRANTAFMAVELGEGYHYVELKYCTYGLKMGILLSVTGFILFVGLVIVNGRRNGYFPKKKGI